MHRGCTVSASFVAAAESRKKLSTTSATACSSTCMWHNLQRRGLLIILSADINVHRRLQTLLVLLRCQLMKCMQACMSA